MRAQQATLIHLDSCRVTNTLLLLLAQALHFLLPQALAPHALRVLGALLLGAAENAPSRTFPPTSSRRTLQSAPYLALPMDPLPWAARSSCSRPPSTSRSSRTALRPKRADRRDRGGQTGLPEGEVPRSTSSRCPIPTPLHQPALHYLSEGPIGSADLRKDVQQLKLPVRRVEVEQRDDEDGRQILPPTILREQQRSTYTTCVEVAGRTLLRAQEAWRRERCRRKPPENSPASRPRSTSKASMASTSLCAHPAKAPFNPTPTAQRRSRGRAALSEGLIATSHAFSAPLQGQHGQRCGGAPSSGTTRRLCGRGRASA